MGLTMHANSSSDSHDLYLSLIHTRHEGSSRGWTAIGTGSEMAGSLMFIVYGDPLSNEDPIVSIRTANGHVQPQLITREASGGLDMRVLRSQWVPSSQSFTPDRPIYEARISLVCYSCHLWPGSKIDVTDRAQPWIWAWNERQEFDVFSYDAHLDMHKHHAGAGGWGRFYVDTARSINKSPGLLSLPPIRQGITALGASESLVGSSKIGLAIGVVMSPAWHLHGLLMGAAFLVLLPAGVIGIRSGSTKAFKYHWVLQLVATIFTALGMTTGLLLSKRITTYHQAEGLAIMGSLILQGLLGWQHHRSYLKSGERTYISYIHIWLGRLVIVAGWTNLFTGLVLRGYPKKYLAIMVTVIGAELVGIIVFMWWRYTRQLRAKRQDRLATLKKSGNRLGDYFTVADNESDEEDSSGDSAKEDEKILTNAE